MVQFKNIKAILTDIEGTTSSISFVHEVLFPYSKQQMPVFLEQNFEKAEVQKILLEVLAKDVLTKENDLQTCLEILQSWIDQDKKLKPLKDLQGLIWEQGYKNGDYHGHIYDDAYNSILNWYSQKIPVYIYSSGSVHAQKLLFGFSLKGDINYLFSGNFDTNIGGKKEPESYQKISQQLNLPAKQILFLSDIAAELDAASKAGLEVLQLLRPGTEAIDRHQAVKSFDEIDLLT